jgi:hypothetical protein
MGISAADNVLGEFSSTLSGLTQFLLSTHGVRHGLNSAAASRLNQLLS